MLNLFKQILGGGPDLKGLLEEGAVIVDVRSPQEFQGGHVAGSINIPVGEISTQVSRLQKANKPIITCCASGMRSASAATILKNAGLDAVNGGPWTTVNKAQAEAAK